MMVTRRTLRRVLGIGLAWGLVWLAFWTIIAALIAVFNPDSIDPGEELMVLVIFGPMGLFTGIAFGILRSVYGGDRRVVDISIVHVIAWGILATAIIQVPYLGHGDQGLAANIMMALLFSAAGGVVTILWLMTARIGRQFNRS